MSNYELVWADEFNYEGKPDASKWVFETGGHGWGNNEAQYYTDRVDNAYVKDGKLVIEARKEDYENRKYTSAKLTTYSIQSWQYGKIAVSAKLPQGKGTWPAIWMLSDSIKSGKGWPLCGEIDIMEHVGWDQDRIHFSLHTEKYNHVKKTQMTEFYRIPNVSNEFNEYAIEWTPESIEFFFNGKSYTKFVKGQNNQDIDEAGWPFDQPFYLILNLAIGGGWGGEIDDSIFPSKLEIDYVRVYKK